MKKYLIILLIFPFVLKAQTMEPSVVLSELYFDTNRECIIELQHSDALGISNENYYYWENHKKKELTLLPSYVRAVTYDLEMDTTDLKELVGIPNVKILLHDRTYHTNMFRRENQEYNYALLEDSLLIDTDLSVHPEIFYVSKNLFLNSDDREVIFGDLFYVYIKNADSMDLHLLDSMALANRVDYLGVQSSVYYGFKCTKKSAGDALEMANLFYESGFFTSAWADLILVRWESSLKTPSAEKINIYTSGGELILEPPSGSRLLELYSVQGTKLGSYVLNEGKNFKLELPPGMYLYKIYAGKCYTGKMLLP